jgi:hypothetical protein
MPSFSPKFRGFDFKQNFRRIFPRAKISAVADRAQAPHLGPVVDRQPVRPSRLKSVCVVDCVAAMFHRARRTWLRRLELRTTIEK